jgi:endonuclease YncB( thermonuclease family)
MPLFLLLLEIGCAASDRAFPLRQPMTLDTDVNPVSVACRSSPTPKDPHNVSCAPDVYVSPLIWDGTDNMLFRPLSEAVGLEHHGEAVNVNSLDEVPDSSWFSNRIGAHALGTEELLRGACSRALILDPDSSADGTWIIDHGKDNGSSPGFRVKIPGKGKYLLKGELPEQPERPSAASVIGAAVYAAAGFNTSCEQIVYFRPSLLKLTPGLTHKGNFGATEPFDQKAVDKILADSPHRDGLVRMQASAWLPGYLIGPFRYTGTRSDDPNDIIPHDDRRELRGGRLVAAWLDHFDAREQNTMDSWVTESPQGRAKPDSSPGHVVHYYLDTSDCLGSEWDWEQISRRLGYSYVADWGDMARDLVTLGIPTRPWDRVRRAPGQEIFGFFNVKDFEPDEWKNEYPNAAFSRMTERDGAWMARILAHFTPDMVDGLAAMAKFSDPARTAYLASVLKGRLEKILKRYLTRLSPLTGAHVEGTDRLCAEDLAETRRLRQPAEFRYSAQLSNGRSETVLSVERQPGGGICVSLPHVAHASSRDDAHERYVHVAIADGVAQAPLVVHLYDLGSERGYRLAGIERPGP